MPKLQHILYFVEDEPRSQGVQRLLDVAAQYGAKLTVAAVVPPARGQVLLSRPGLDLSEIERLIAEDQARKLAAMDA